MTSPNPAATPSPTRSLASKSSPAAPLLWALRVAWFALPFVAGPLFGDALDPEAVGFQRTATIALWALWGAGLAATLIPHPRSLTALRLLATGALPFGVWAAASRELNAWTVIGLAALLAAASLAMLPHTAAVFVDGESYGDERRLPLRPPVGALLGPLPLAWVVTVAGFATGPLLLASGRGLFGGIVTAVGLPLALLGLRSLHTLARRFLVFVPAGFVLHDLTALTDPVLFRREDVQILGPAFTDSVAKDLTLGASGLALEARFTRPLTVPVRTSGGPEKPAELRSVLVSPSQPGVVLAEAERRRLRVG